MASVLAILILGIRMLVKDRVGIKWQNVMWFLLIIKLLLPITPVSIVSLYNILSFSNTKLIHSDIGVQKKIGYSEEAPISQETGRQAASLSSNNTPNSPVRNADSKAINTDFVSNFLLFTWLAGLLTLTGYTLYSQRKLIIQIRKQSRCFDRNVLRVLEDCKQIMNVVKSIAVVESSIAQSPTLFGFIRPVLLLPEKYTETLSSQQLRHIFLHELAHVKRKDILVNWLTSFVQMVHWFNPILWYAFYKMREDQEIACDELALTCLDSSETREYANTIIRLVEVYSAQKTTPGLASVLRKKSEVQRRVLMATMFEKKSIKWSVLGLSLVVTLGVVTLTGAKEPIVTSTYGQQAMQKETNPSKQLIETASIDIPEIGDILEVHENFNGGPNLKGTGIKIPILDPSNLAQKELILKLLADLHNAKKLPDEQPKGYPIRANWCITIYCKNGKSVEIHGNYSTKSVQQEHNGIITAVGTSSTPIPDEYLVKYLGKNEETKIYSRELSEWKSQYGSLIQKNSIVK
jgi:bla regulator protein blaR1